MNSRISKLVDDYELKNSRVTAVYRRVIEDLAHRGVAEMSGNEYNSGWCAWKTITRGNQRHTLRWWYHPKEYIMQKLATIGYRVRVTGGNRSGYRFTLVGAMG